MGDEGRSAHVLARLGWPSSSPPDVGNEQSEPSGLGWPDQVGEPGVIGGTSDAERPATVEVSRETPSESGSPAPGVDDPVSTDQKSAPDPAPSRAPIAEQTEQDLLLVRGRGQAGPLPTPARTRIFAVANQKGGVGKTTTVVNIAAALAQSGHRVLVVDLDPQGNASTALAIKHAEGTSGAYEVIVDAVPVCDVVQDSSAVAGLTVVPASIDLAGAEIDLVSLVARESRLRRALTGYLDDEAAAGRRFDEVFIDCPPSLGLLTVNALVAAEEILVPVQCEYYALEGIGQLMRTVEMVRAHLNPPLAVSTIILTMHDARTRLSAGVADEVRAHFPSQVLRTAIPRSVRISEAPSYQQTVMTYDPGSSGALSYLEAAREIAERSDAVTGDPS